MIQRDLYERCRAAVPIDLHALTEELIRHPQLVLDANDGLSDAADAQAKASAYLGVVKAQVASMLREQGIEGKQVSDTRITAELPHQEDVVAAKEAEIAAERDKRLWDSVVSAVIAKGSSLKRLAELTVSGYLAPNAGPRAAEDDEADQNRRAMAERRRQTTRRPLPPE
jgi:hypothetical protein